MLADVAGDGLLEVGDGAEHAALEPLSGQRREEAFDSVDPGCRGWGEVEHPSRMALEPSAHFGMFVGSVVVRDRMDQLACGHGTFDGVEEADELLMTMLGHAAAEHRAIANIERGKQGGDPLRL